MSFTSFLLNDCGLCCIDRRYPCCCWAAFLTAPWLSVKSAKAQLWRRIHSGFVKELCVTSNHPGFPPSISVSWRLFYRFHSVTNRELCLFWRDFPRPLNTEHVPSGQSQRSVWEHHVAALQGYRKENSCTAGNVPHAVVLFQRRLEEDWSPTSPTRWKQFLL